jgi:hypothetical protein
VTATELATKVLRDIISGLDIAGIPHMLVGSFASTSYSTPRTTQDIDIVIDPAPPALDRFSESLDRDRFYVESTAQDALAARDQFNVIDFTTGWKVDLIS